MGFMMGCIGKSIPPTAMKNNWALLKTAWHNRVRDAYDTRELMAAELLLESYIKFDALRSWWKKYYIASYSKVRKQSVIDRLPRIHGAATLMANPTLPLLVSRLLVLDQGIDYETKVKKKRGRKGGEAWHKVSGKKKAKK